LLRDGFSGKGRARDDGVFPWFVRKRIEEEVIFFGEEGV
jgi:hypothetical protein